MSIPTKYVKDFILLSPLTTNIVEGIALTPLTKRQGLSLTQEV